MKQLYLWVLAISLSTPLFAQHYQHFTNWSRLSVQKDLSPNWEFHVELHWRRQSNFRLSRYNPFAEPLAEAFRFTILHRHKAMTYSFTPFFFHSEPLLGTEDDFNRPNRMEIRPVWYAEWTAEKRKWTYRIRGGYEYRIFRRTDGSWGDPQGRARLRFQARYVISESNKLVFSEEPLLNVFPNVPPNSFSQNQLYTGWNHAWSEHFVSEIGYNYVLRQRASLVEYDDENVLQIALIIKL